MKRVQKLQALKMRQEGFTIPHIAETLEVSRSTVSVWLRDVKVSESITSQIATAAAKKRSKSRSLTCLKQRLEYREMGCQAAQLKDDLHHAACMLYWAEGTKKVNSCVFSNSDPEMMLLFNNFLNKFFPNEPKTLSIQFHADSSREEVCRYWSNLLGIPNFGFVLEKDSSKNGTRKNRHKYGVCSIVVNSTQVVQHIYGAINEYIGSNKEFALHHGG